MSSGVDIEVLKVLAGDRRAENIGREILVILAESLL